QLDIEAIEVIGPEPVDLLFAEAGHDPALHVASIGGDRRRRGVLLEIGQPVLEEPLQRSDALVVNFPFDASTASVARTSPLMLRASHLRRSVGAEGFEPPTSAL